MSDPENVYWGIPAKREIAADPVLDQVEWFFREARCNDHRLAFGRAIGNLIAVNRSFLIAQAKKAIEIGFPNTLLMMDTDAKPITPSMHDALLFVKEDFRLGYDLVLAPVHTLAKKDSGEYAWFEEWKDAPGAERTEEGPWPVLGGSLTQSFLSPKLLTRLTMLKKPDGTDYWWEPNNAKPIPMYCETRDNHTEDIHLCNRVREELELRVCCDGRLKIRHQKVADSPAFGELPSDLVGAPA